MSKIHVLNEQLTNIIAAGEVVERPMGVVKELVENSIDAQAKHIDVMISQGGLESIVVIDDGAGIDAADVALAFKRHSTSKISTIDDLVSLATHGFRGEALPSIASVSNCVCITNNGVTATKAHFSYGKTIEIGPTFAALGTTMRVEGLFQKTPARLKHMKSIPYENALILDVMRKFAISYAHIGFTLTIDGKKLFETQGTTLEDVIYRLYGKEIAQHHVVINAQNDDFCVNGFISAPFLHRATRKDMMVFTNSRMIRSTVINKAVTDAFADFIPKDRYPFAVIFITMDKQLLDVNVHPSKWEVRISKERDLQAWLTQVIRQTLVHEQKPKPIPSQSITKEYYEPLHIMESLENAMMSAVKPIQNETKTSFESNVVSKDEKNFSKHAHVIAQLHKKYILATNAEGLIILDQHAAMERIRFEYYLKQSKATKGQTPLLFPVVIDDKRAMLYKEELIHIFKSIDVSLDQFHTDALVIREIPTWLNQVDAIAVINDIVLQLEEKTLRKTDILNAVFARMACHSSVRFNESLSIVEMQKIVDDLFVCEFPYQCPHGRPTMMTMTLDELFKEFGR